MKATHLNSPAACANLRFSVGALLALTTVAAFVLLVHLT